MTASHHLPNPAALGECPNLGFDPFVVDSLPAHCLNSSTAIASQHSRQRTMKAISMCGNSFRNPHLGQTMRKTSPVRSAIAFGASDSPSASGL
jgi:hypothetical protein